MLLSFALIVLLWPRNLLGRQRLNNAERTIVLGAVAIVIFVAGVRNNTERLVVEREVRVSNVYHYYLGAKYFPELGYADLYSATLLADRETNGYWDDAVDLVRDLRTYKVVPRSEVENAFDPAVAFTPARWEDFKRDVVALSSQRSPRRWRSIFRDRGYNGTPLWTVMGQTLTRWVPADSFGLVVLCSLDLLLFALTMWLVFQTFGAGSTVLFLLLFAVSPANVPRFVGGFLQSDWLWAVTCAVCFIRRDRPVVAGACMAFAVMTRAFPAALVAGFALPVVIEWIRTRTLPRRAILYPVAVAAFCFVGLLASLPNGHSYHAWQEFREAISIHRDQHAFDNRRIGLEHTFTGQPLDFSREIEKDERREFHSQRRGWYWGSAAVLCSLFLAAAIRRKPSDAQLLALALVFSLLVLSRYYYGLLALLPLMTAGDLKQRWLVTGGQIAVFLGFYLSVLSGASVHTSYTFLNLLLTLYFVALLLNASRSHQFESPEGRNDILVY